MINVYSDDNFPCRLASTLNTFRHKHILHRFSGVKALKQGSRKFNELLSTLILSLVEHYCLLNAKIFDSALEIFRNLTGMTVR